MNRITLYLYIFGRQRKLHITNVGKNANSDQWQEQKARCEELKYIKKLGAIDAQHMKIWSSTIIASRGYVVSIQIIKSDS